MHWLDVHKRSMWFKTRLTQRWARACYSTNLPSDPEESHRGQDRSPGLRRASRQSAQIDRLEKESGTRVRKTDPHANQQKMTYLTLAREVICSPADRNIPRRRYRNGVSPVSHVPVRPFVSPAASHHLRVARQFWPVATHCQGRRFCGNRIPSIGDLSRFPTTEGWSDTKLFRGRLTCCRFFSFLGDCHTIHPGRPFQYIVCTSTDWTIPVGVRRGCRGMETAGYPLYLRVESATRRHKQQCFLSESLSCLFFSCQQRKRKRVFESQPILNSSAARQHLR